MKSVVVLSGGMDSVTLLYWLRAQRHEVRALSFDYGQRHRRELQFAERVCKTLEVPWALADLSAIRTLIAGTSSQMRDEVPVPEGHYADESMKQTIVPNRNMIMLSVAIGHAVAEGCEAVAYGAHAGDHAIYPDCREPFASAMAEAAQQCDWKPVELLRPFVHKTKAEIAKLGHELGVPFAETWSCYKGLEAHCGRCGTCVERREAFQLAGVPDPTIYAP